MSSMTYGELSVLVFAVFALLFALLLIARPWRHEHEAQGNDHIAWLILDGLVALWLLVIIFGLIFSILLITLWANPEFPRSEERRVGKECGSRWSRYH